MEEVLFIFAIGSKRIKVLWLKGIRNPDRQLYKKSIHPARISDYQIIHTIYANPSTLCSSSYSAPDRSHTPHSSAPLTPPACFYSLHIPNSTSFSLWTLHSLHSPPYTLPRWSLLNKMGIIETRPLSRLLTSRSNERRSYSKTAKSTAYSRFLE